jgi:hypothetical protein
MNFFSAPVLGIQDSSFRWYFGYLSKKDVPATSFSSSKKIVGASGVWNTELCFSLPGDKRVRHKKRKSPAWSAITRILLSEFHQGHT